MWNMTTKFSENMTQLVSQDFYVAQSQSDCFNHYQNDVLEKYCKPLYEEPWCWAPAYPNTTVFQLCPVKLKLNGKELKGEISDGFATFDCSENGTWTNLNASLCDKPEEDRTERPLITIVLRLLLHICSSFSLVTLGISLFIFFYFKSLNCSRIRVHRNFCLALIFNLLFLWAFSLGSFMHKDFQNIDLLCKSLFTFYQYFCMACINWMFVEGLLLHSRVTTHIFMQGGPFKLYYSIGWGLPAVFMTSWVIGIEMRQTSIVKCWGNYMNEPLFYIVTVPILIVLLINAAFLVNIIRIVANKNRNNVEKSCTEFNQIKKALKASALLFPLLGMPHLIIGYRPTPGTISYNVYAVVNVLLQTSQGTIFSIIYCFMNDDVQTALRKAYNRCTADRKIRRHTLRGLSQTSNTLLSDTVLTPGRKISTDLNKERRISTGNSPFTNIEVCLSPSGIRNCIVEKETKLTML